MNLASKKTIEVVKDVISQSSPRKFLETIELAINIKEVDLSIPKNRIDEEVLLPKGRGKEQLIAVFGSGELAVKAKSSADRVITPDEIEELAGDKREARKFANKYNHFISEAPLMPVIGKQLGVVLGPRGKMPKPIPPAADPGPMVKNLKNTVRVRSKDRKTFHVPVGTKKMTVEDIADNIETIMKRVTGRLERGKNNIAAVYVKTSMGKSVKLM